MQNNMLKNMPNMLLEMQNMSFQDNMTYVNRDSNM